MENKYGFITTYETLETVRAIDGTAYITHVGRCSTISE